MGVTQGFHSEHKAIDWVSGYGTPLCAPEKVRIMGITIEKLGEGYVGLKQGYGVKMKGLETGLEYLYWHCWPIFPVWGGDIAEAGQIVAYMGNSGYVTVRGSYVPLEERALFPHRGTHLHLVIWRDNIEVDPLKFIAMDQEPKYTVADQLVAIQKVVTKIGTLLAKGKL